MIFVLIRQQILNCFLSRAGTGIVKLLSNAETKKNKLFPYPGNFLTTFCAMPLLDVISINTMPIPFN